MKKLFISQPMRGKEECEIKEEREKEIKAVKESLGEPVQALDSIFDGAPEGAKPLWYLAKAIEILSSADVAFFASGWEKYRGCRIEHQCALDYGIQLIEQ